MFCIMRTKETTATRIAKLAITEAPSLRPKASAVGHTFHADIVGLSGHCHKVFMSGAAHTTSGEEANNQNTNTPQYGDANHAGKSGKMNRVAIVGSRNFKHLEQVYNYVEALGSGSCVVSGGARGVDEQAIRAAKSCGLHTVVFNAEWGLYGRAAGPIRNEKMIQYVDVVVAFWDGKSRGTENMIQLAQKYKKPIKVFNELLDVGRND